ncbi:dTMP kinase [Salipaludibacillus aurantiacus]|uniref:Thymidylate kinase n=1 Tax=Salipaludibacillus aurantiacus TaxID=1601833 RepID=A0A1H9X2Y0_9BACI|nr:dTMP kinase [Salipaludibacillus aurantiacus]SES40568.1 dTMP kinase [Salipaludibacillus aurantiacus]
MSGIFITFEGGEGAGKTTVLQKIKQKLEEEGRQVIATREPGGSIIAEKIRQIILDPAHTEMDRRTEALLYAAARRQHLAETVIPYLNKGGIVLCDRFVDSSLVYQGVARGIGVEEVLNLNLFATEGMLPDLTLYFDIEPEKGLARIAEHKGREYNRLDRESLVFHYQVREAYLELQKKAPERIHTIDASDSLEEVTRRAWQEISGFLKNK